MSGEDSLNYAPKSPDLSSFYSAGPTQPAPQLALPTSDNHRDPEYKSEPLPLPSYGLSSSYAPPATSASIHHQHQHQQQPPHYSQQLHYQLASPPPALPIKTEYPNYPPTAHLQYLPTKSTQPLPAQTGYDLQPQFHLQQHQALFGQPYINQHPHPDTTSYVQGFPHSGVPPASPTSPTAATRAPTNMPPRKAPAAPAPIIEPSPVRTKFPTARIKRIMQADEEVGKVAQQTPIAVGKALELFMIQMVSKSADVAKEKGSKRVTAHMLKQVVETDEQWDFLRDIVSRVENEKEGAKGKAKTESSSDEEMPEPKKKTRGGRRKKAA